MVIIPRCDICVVFVAFCLGILGIWVVSAISQDVMSAVSLCVGLSCEVLTCLWVYSSEWEICDMFVGVCPST